MNWRLEEQKKPRISKETLDKRYIKEELMRYDMYIGRVIDLKCAITEFKEEYAEFLNDPTVGGSVVRMPDGGITSQNPVMRMEYKLNSLESNLQYYEQKLDTLDDWLGTLSQKQLDTINVYAREYQCQGRSHAALDLRYSEETVKKHTERAIDRIYTRFKEKL